MTVSSCLAIIFEIKLPSYRRWKNGTEGMIKLKLFLIPMLLVKYSIIYMVLVGKMGVGNSTTLQYRFSTDWDRKVFVKSIVFTCIILIIIYELWVSNNRIFRGFRIGNLSSLNR